MAIRLDYYCLNTGVTRWGFFVTNLHGFHEFLASIRVICVNSWLIFKLHLVNRVSPVNRVLLDWLIGLFLGVARLTDYNSV